MQRKTVTVLFCDVTGSTELGESIDPEALRGLLARYFERMKAIVEHHGGTVEKFIGDAVMAVFGVPVAHEDDALRAARAAVEMRDAMPELGLEARLGLNTGEVVTGTEERLATGDAVNVAARLEQAAAPGEVLLGDSAVALLGGAIEIEPVTPLALKGKAEPVPAYRLLAVHDVPERPHVASFVGRQRELAAVRESWDRACLERRCELLTLVGDAGVGKSRLAGEALGAAEARVVRGRCLPYGEGITYWPVVEVLKQLDVAAPEGAAARTISSLLGETDAPTSGEEIAWAFRKTLELAATEHPLAVVFDDIQWGEEALLDLVEHVALLSSGAPILLLCLARPELGERRPTWPVTLRLEPLGDEDVEELIPRRIPGRLRERIARAAGGNPLFIHEMLAMASESDGEVAVPPTLQALLAARLDQLDTAERSVLERGAVEGEVFHRGAVQALAPAETQVTPRLAALVRKQLIRPDHALLPEEDAFRFRHLLILEAAYDSLAKATRAELHERFALWLEERGAALVELDEILGHHLEQAWRYQRELRLDGDGELAARARQRLRAAGVRARERKDERAAASFFQRTLELAPPGEIDLELENDLLESLYWSDRASEALEGARSLGERGAAAGDPTAELCGRILEGVYRTSLDPEGATEALAALLEQALPIFEEAGAETALYIAYRAQGMVKAMHAHMDAARIAYERAASYAHRAGRQELLGWRAATRFMGTTSISDLNAWLDEQQAQGLSDHQLDVKRAMALAMCGRFAEARAIVPGAAAEIGQEAMRLYDELGELSFASTTAAIVAEAAYQLGRLDEAESWAARAAELGASDDAITQVLWRQVRAKVLARRGEHEEAERLARTALALVEQTQMLNPQAEAYADLGEVLELAGREPEAAVALEQALERYERKENLVMAEGTRERLAALRNEAV